jgi:serine/threonine-protein kinase
MAPEQFAGLGSDARADQFSFCVTLYEAVCGERPFGATAAPEHRRAPASPPPGWRCSARLFDTIARGLANRPEDRWPSLTALLEALEEDRVARRYRIGAVAAVAVLTITLLIGWIGARRSASQRVRTAQAMGQQIQRIQTRMRAAYLLPLHDTKPERDRVREQMKAIQAQLLNLGDEARGPGELALGIGHFVLGEHAEARQHLENAWAAGQRSPDLAYDLGLVLGEAYRLAKANPPPSQTKEQLEARDRELKRTLRDPAAAYLRQAEGAADTSPRYLAALLATLDRRHDEALREVEAALGEVPSLYEATILGGEIQSERAVAAFNANDKTRGLSLLADAEARFQRALEIGRSDPHPYRSYSDWLMSFAWYAERLGQDSAPMLEHTMALCRQGQQADSDAKWPDTMIANAGWMLADSALIHHRDPRPHLATAVSAAERAVARDPHYLPAYANLGAAWLSRANDWDLIHGGDAGASFAKSVDAFQSAVKIGGDVDLYNNLGLATAGLAAWRSAHGDDAGALVESALAAFDHARALRPDLHFADTNACDTLGNYAREQLDRGADITALVERADRYCAAARAGDPGMPEPFDESARLEGVRAEAAGRAGADPLPLWDRAVRDEETALRLNPRSAAAQAVMAELAAHRAEYWMQNGKNGRPDLIRAQTTADEAVHLESEWPDGDRARTLLELVRARAALAHGDPMAAITAGLAASERVLRIRADDALTLRRAAELRWIEARARTRRGLPPSTAVARGRELIRRSLAVDARSGSARAIEAGLEQLADDR